MLEFDHWKIKKYVHIRISEGIDTNEATSYQFNPLYIQEYFCENAQWFFLSESIVGNQKRCYVMLSYILELFQIHK